METKNRTLSKVLSTSNQDVYVAPARWNADVYSLIITNTSNATKLITLEWYDSLSAAWYYLMKDTPLIANGIVQIEEPLYLAATDKIRGLANANSTVVVTLRLREDFATAL